MDFGNILDEWERRDKGGILDKDALSQTTIPKAEIRRRLLRKKPDAVIDLHGLTRDEAWDALEIFFKNAEKESFDKLLIIHGKGNHSNGESVLNRTVREFLERCPTAGQSGHSRAPDGGSGATWVLLKNKKEDV